MHPERVKSMRPPRQHPLANSIARSWAYGALMLALVLPALSRGAAAASGVSADKPSSALSEDARAWLTRTDEALARRNYRGVFVHELHGYGGEAETLEVIHRVGSDGVSERLVSMDGSGREFIRRNGQLSCYLPDQRTVLVLKSARPTLPLNVPQLDAQWSEHYDVRQVDVTRVSGHRVRVIAVTPLDAMRYGYRVWIDDATAMPLKTQLCDAHGQVIEQIVFASLTLSARIPDSAFRPEFSTAGFQWVRAAQGPLMAPADSSTWNALQLPPGFRMSLRAAQTLPGSTQVVDHLVFTDGVASVSVFVEHRETSATAAGGAPEPPPAPEAATVGSSSAFSTVVNGHKITAVGEVPPQTVQFIATQVKAQSAAPAGGGARPAQ